MPVAETDAAELVRGISEVEAPTAMVPVTAARPSAVQRSTKAVGASGEGERGRGRGEGGEGVSGLKLGRRGEGRTVVVGYDGGAVACRGRLVGGDAGGTRPWRGS